jgi:MOSC domain-containing protein YiiM
MPALVPTDFFGEVVWLGAVMSEDGPALLSEKLERLDLGFAGVSGAVHEGTTRASCVRVEDQYPEGTEIHNERQLSLLSAEELDDVAVNIGLDSIDPARLGANIVLKGIPDFTHVPPGSRLQGPSGVTLTVDMENLPCNIPARSIEKAHPGHGKGFKAAAAGNRGVTAWVARPGELVLGETMRLHVPGQRAWTP